MRILTDAEIEASYAQEKGMAGFARAIEEKTIARLESMRTVVRAKTQTVSCTDCGAEETVELPKTVDDLVAALRDFDERHEHGRGGG